MKEVGVVKWFSAPKGYGFIKRSDGQDVFVHFSSIMMDGYRKLEEGNEVEFEIKEGPKGLQAYDVTSPEAAADALEPPEALSAEAASAG